MNEKTNLQDLAVLIAEKSGITTKEVDYFLKELIETVQETLLNEESVRIKNLGTFKRLTVSERESVDVSTGKRVLIPAHSKINFIPDNNLAQMVNDPFASFEPVELPASPERKVTADPPPVIPPVTIEKPVGTEEPIPYPTPPPRTSSRKKRKNTKWVGSLIFILLVMIMSVVVAYFFFLPGSDSSTNPALNNRVFTQKQKTEEDVKDNPAEENAVENNVEDNFSEETITEEDNSVIVEDKGNIEEDNAVLTPVETVEKKTVGNLTETTDSAKQYTLQSGDRLMTIALREYGDRNFWAYLYEENKDKIKNPDLVPAGLTITIPPASKYNINKDNPASLKDAKALQQKILRQQKPQQQNWQQQKPKQQNQQQQDWQQQDWENWSEQDWQQFYDGFPH